jgi:hypothetical protein
MAYFVHAAQPNQVITIQLNENYTCEIARYSGSCGEYYKINNICYDIHFPIDWVFQQPIFDIDIVHPNEIPFGPETCYNCFAYGYYNGVFIGYCATCADIINNERGNGLIGDGVEMEGDERKSIWNLYLQNVSLEEIGDRNLYIDHSECVRVRDNLMNIGFVDDYDNDAITIHYDDMVYNTCLCEDDITIAFSSSTDNNFVDVDSFDEDDMFMEVDSIS